jgi:hypothetical protein
MEFSRWFMLRLCSEAEGGKLVSSEPVANRYGHALDLYLGGAWLKSQLS